jgi:hypothetical protein
MSSDFDATREPMRALRDLIVACECIFGPGTEEQAVLRRAQDAFAALRAEFGDVRPSEAIAEAPMHEPRGMREALELSAAALQVVAPLLKNGERQVLTFTTRWTHIPPTTIAKILDRADAALETHHA